MPHNAAGVAQPGLREIGRVRFASDRLPWQRSLRWKKAPIDRRLLLAGLLIAVAFTVIELVGFGLDMQRQIAREVRPARPRTVEVVLIEPPPAFPLPPEPEPPPFAPRKSKVRVEAPEVKLPPPPHTAEESDDAMRARIGESGMQTPQLFNPDGSIRLAPPPVAPAQPMNPQEAAKQRWAEIEKRGENPLDCKRTRFAGAFRPDESLGDAVSRKYLKWIGLADAEAIRHRAEQRERRAAEGCDPVQ